MEPQETASAAKWVNLWLLDSDGIEKGLDGYVDIDMSDAADAKYFDTICQEAGEGITKQLRGFLTSELAELGAAGQAGLADLAKDMESCRYNLARLPANYKVVKKHDPTQDHGPYRYYIVGHPATEFTGTKDFLPHLIWLANKRRGKCSCRACNLKPVAATPRPKSEVAVAQPSAAVPANDTQQNQRPIQPTVARTRPLYHVGEVVWLLKDAKSPVLQLGFILSRYRVTSGDNEIPMYIIQPLGTHFIEEKVEHIQQKSMKPFLSLTVPGMANKNLSIVPFNQVDWQSLAQQAKSQGTRETRQLTTEASKLAARTVDCSFSVFRIARQNPRTSELVPAIANDVDGAFLGAERIVRGDVVRINSMRVAMAANGALGQALSITRDSIRIMHVQRLSLTSDYGTPEKPSVAGTLVFVGTIFAPRRYPSAAEAAAAQAQYRDVLPAVLLDDLRDANAGGTISVPNGAAPGTMAAAAHPGATHWIWVPTIQTASLTADLIAGRYYGGANLSRIVSASTLSTTRERNFAMAATAAAAEAGGPAASQQQQQAYPAPVAEHSFLNSFWGRNSIQGYFRGEVPSRLDAFRDMVPAHTTLEFRWPDIAAAVAQGAMDPPEGLPVVLPPQQQQQQQQAKVGWKPPPFPPPAVVAEPRWEEAPLLLQEGRLPGDLPPQQG